MANERMFRYQRKRFAPVKRVPVKASNLRWRLRLGREWQAWEWSWHHTHFLPIGKYDLSTKAGALCEVLHSEPGRARAWGDCPPSEVLWDILARARCGIPAGVHVEW